MKSIFSFLLIIILFYGCEEMGDLLKSNSGEGPKLDPDGIQVNRTSVLPFDTVRASIYVENPEEGPHSYSWSSENGGTYLPPADRDTVYWIAPYPGGTHCYLSVKVKNEVDEVSAPARQIWVQNTLNPVMKIDKPSPLQYFILGEPVNVEATIQHVDGLKWIKMYIIHNDSELLIDSIGFKTKTSYYIYKRAFTATANMVGKTQIKINAMANNAASPEGSDMVMINVEGIIPGEAQQ